MNRSSAAALLATVVLSGCGYFRSEPPPAIAPEQQTAPAEGGSEWNCSRDESGFWTCAGDGQPSPEARRPGSGGAVPMTPDDYLLQVGAFRERERALAEARRIGRPEMLVLPTRRDGQEIFVLVLGVYASEAAATAAGDAYLAEHPQGTVWVRPARDVRTALAARN